MRHNISHPLFARRFPIAMRHVDGGADLVQEHEAARIHAALPHPKAAALRSAEDLD
ncbi:MAG: hypothetical protein K0Q60_2630, partial [Microvirga sp.]|nr:hypothetical protein [Microvirga sp.]